jgi:copper chaperone CopZ
MSRRKGEFEHRTSIFEGAYRAWSHLGGCDPDKLLSVNAADELDPLLYPHTDDIRLIDSTDNTIAIDGRMQYAYEPLPRTGLQHPFVQGIIAPWLGPKADEEDVKQGLTTLRTWWQHRRKRESASAIKALGTDKMLGVVEGYTRHFFKMAVCMVVHDHEQPPRSLLGRLQLRHNLDENTATKSYTSMASTVTEKLTRQLSGSNHDFLPEPETSGGVSCCGGGPPTAPNAAPGAPIEVAGQPAKKIQRREMEDMDMEMDTEPIMSNTQPSLYGDPSRTPVVFVSANGDIQVAMSIQGITCTQCVKMIETVLKGVDGSLSNIDGLLDAVADKDLAAVIIKIARASDAKRIVFQSAEVLSMLGYTATPREMDVTNNKGVKLDLSSLSAAYDIVAATDAKDVFDWSLRCNCPDNGVIRDDCVR